MVYLITGATGNVGSLVTERLLARGERTRIFVRDADKARARYGDRVDVFIGHLADAKTLAAALAGADALLLVNSGPELAALDELAAKAEDRGRAPTSYWIGFRLKEFPQSRVTVEIKPDSGVVDLRFFGVPIGELRRKLDAVKPDGTETEEAQSGKSVSIRARHPHMDLEQPFPGQEMVLHSMLASADQLRKFAIDQQETIMRLLGYETAHDG